MRTLSTFVAAAICVTALLGCAQTGHAARLADVSVINRDTGERLKLHRHHGKLYVAGTPGHRYSIEVRNRDRQRVLAVMSVDGVNVVTGETASPTQSGYVLSAYQRYQIAGWRKSSEEIAQFVFTALPNSYAARTGRPDNVGVIGLALFKEKPEPQPLYAPPAAFAPERRSNESASDAVGAAPQSPKESFAERSAASGMLQKQEAKRLGTGHGQREVSRTSWTDFERARTTPNEVVAIYYDSEANLIARGIIEAPHPRPLAFPAGNGFVPDPS